ncbi:hypothetical protein [Paracoccus sp. (in: a-proteobacteria)]|uniref:hypothetical protein n=1 Tax=Paracoccus sp. TaxID=267 RepID=UPI003A86E303
MRRLLPLIVILAVAAVGWQWSDRLSDAARTMLAGDAATEAEAAAESALAAMRRGGTTFSVGQGRAAPAPQTAAVLAGAISDELTPNGLDRNRANALIDAATIPDLQKAVLRRLVETAGDNPDLLRAALAHAESVME